MEKQIKISVIVPVYNTEKFIEKCLDSILNQTLKEIEVIAINDGSTDNSLEKIKKYEKDNRVKIINKKNEGASKTRNRGLENAKGKYIYFIDSDDYLENNEVLEKLYQQCENEDLDILIFDYYLVTDKKKEYKKNIISENKIISNEEYFYNILDYNGCSIWCKLIKRDLYLQNNIKFLEKIFMSEDWNISLKLGCKAVNIGKLNEGFYCYVEHENQGTKKINIEKNIQDEYESMLDLVSFFKKEKNVEYEKAVKLKIYQKYLKEEYKKTEMFKKIKEKFLLEDKKELLKCKYYKSWILKNKLKFYIRNILF